MHILIDANNLAMRLLHVAAMNSRFSFDYWKYLMFTNVYDLTLDVFGEFDTQVKVTLCSDAGNYWRKQVYKPYKADRVKKEFPVEGLTYERFFSEYKDFLAEMSMLLPFRHLEVPTCEADDIIAVLVKNTEGPHYIFSGDSDYFMLSSEDVVVNSPSAGRINFPLSKKVNNVDCFFKSKEEFTQFAILTGQGGKDNVYNVKTATDWEGTRKPGFGPKAAFKVLDSGKDPQTWCEENGLLENYLRNKALIDFDEIPENITEAILTAFAGAAPSVCEAEMFLSKYPWPSMSSQIDLVQANLEGIILGAACGPALQQIPVEVAEGFEFEI